MKLREWMKGPKDIWQDDEVLKLVPWQHRQTLEWRARQDPHYRTVYWALMVTGLGMLAVTILFDSFDMPGLLLVIACLVVVVFRLAPAVKRRRRAAICRDLERRPCWQCGYSTIGLSEPRCPECGIPFDPAVYDAIAAAIERERGEQTPVE